MIAMAPTRSARLHRFQSDLMSRIAEILVTGSRTPTCSRPNTPVTLDRMQPRGNPVFSLRATT